MADDRKARAFLAVWRSAVFASSEDSSAKLVLIALAEFASAQGGDCFPAAETVAALASVNERTVRRQLDALDGSGWFVRWRRREQGQAWRLWEYRLTIPKGPDTESDPLPEAPDTESDPLPEAPDTESDPLEGSTGLSRQKHRTLTTEAPDTVSDYLDQELEQELEVTPAAQRAPVNLAVRNRRKRQQGSTYHDWVTAIPEDGDAIESNDPIFTWATDAGIPDEWLELAWIAFRHRFTGNPKTYTDWRAVFRNYVRNDWLKVWRVTPDGSYALTTTGEQLRRVREAEERRAAA